MRFCIFECFLCYGYSKFCGFISLLVTFYGIYDYKFYVLDIRVNINVYRDAKVRTIYQWKKEDFYRYWICIIGTIIVCRENYRVFLVPNIADSKFMILGSILVLLGIYLVTFEWIRKYLILKFWY